MKALIHAACVLAVGVVAADARGQCQAPAAWFPHEKTPEPDFHAPATSCEFHQWAWQTFLWLTQPTGEGRVRLMDLPAAHSLFMPGMAPATLNAAVRERLAKQPLVLTPRVVKSTEASRFGEIRQAGSRGVLVDRAGRPVYFASHVNPTYYQFVRTNRLYLRREYEAASPTLNFPVRSLELKSSWRVVPPGENADGFFTTPALIHPLTCRAGGDTCKGEDVVVDLTRTEEVRVALVGIHVVGVVEDHPEFIWSTFEHVKNAPDLPAGTPPTSPNPVSPDGHTFYAANTPAAQCNQPNGDSVGYDGQAKTLSPVTQVFRQFAFGGGNAADTAEVTSLNKSVHARLAAGSVWKNYFLVGGVWFARRNALVPGLSGPKMQQLVVGSVRLSNTTMETFTQATRKNCFACHDTAAEQAPLNLPAKNLNISHILMNGLVQRDQLARAPAAAIRAQADPPLTSYGDVKALLTDFVAKHNVPIRRAPHGAFWERMDHKQFTEGNIPGVAHPETGEPLRVLVPKDSKASNLILSLRGAKGTVFDPETGGIGRMPPSGPFMSDADVNRLADWIDRGCPDGPPGGAR